MTAAPYLIAITALLVLDVMWLTIGGTAHKFKSIAESIGPVEPYESVKRFAFAAGAYVLLATAVCLLLSLDKSIILSLVFGCLAGLVIYGVFDCTNLVVFGKAYTLNVALLDICWGTFVIGFSVFLGAIVRENLRNSCCRR